MPNDRPAAVDAGVVGAGAVADDALPPLLRREDRPAVPAGVVVATVLVTLLVLRGMGRVWWCAIGDWSPVVLDAWGPHNSQHFVDPYVFSHFLHGVIFFFALNWGAMRRKPMWGLAAAMLLEAAWEIFENTPFTIDRYRQATAAVGYTGDSVANSFGDLIACLLGWLVARRVGLWWSIGLFAIMEVGCLLWIRDNLTLNVIQIIHPIDAIKRWQSGG
jgi:hypothetical protein